MVMLFSLIQGTIAIVYLMLTIEIIVTSSKSVLEKQLPFEGRLLFLVYSHMVYFGGFNILGLREFTQISMLDFFVNRPIVIAYDWINAFTTSFFGLPLKGNPFFMLTYLVPIFFVYNFVEYWFKYGFSDKRISKLIALAAVIMYISSDNIFGLIPALTSPFAGLVSSIVVGGGVFGILSLMIGLINALPFINLGPLQASVNSLILTTLPFTSSVEGLDGSAGLLGFISGLSPEISGYLSIIVFGFLIALATIASVYMYKWLLSKLVVDVVDEKWQKIIWSWTKFFTLSTFFFWFGFFALNLGMLLLYGANIDFQSLFDGPIMAITYKMLGFVTTFMAMALIAEVLVFAAMFVLFNNLRGLFKSGDEGGEGGASKNAVVDESANQGAAKEDWSSWAD